MNAQDGLSRLFDLSGKVALVAGGAGYLGTPVCRGLALHGATVVVADIHEQRLAAAARALADEFGESRIVALRLDVDDEGSINRTVNAVVAEQGRLDILVNATFWSTSSRLEALTAAEFDQANRVNITSTFLLARSAASVMTEGGSIIVYSSMYGLISPNPADYPEGISPNPVEYGAGKAAITQLVRYLAAHYGSSGIRVNAVAPGAFPRGSVQAGSSDFVGRLSRKSMLGRIGRPEEAVGPVLFLAADAASFVTGQILSVDGGITAW